MYIDIDIDIDLDIDIRANPVFRRRLKRQKKCGFFWVWLFFRKPAKIRSAGTQTSKISCASQQCTFATGKASERDNLTTPAEQSFVYKVIDSRMDSIPGCRVNIYRRK